MTSERESLDVGLSIKLARVRHRARQYDVSRISGLPRSVISEIENGHRRPSPRQLARICAAIGITPDDLEGGAA